MGDPDRSSPTHPAASEPLSTGVLAAAWSDGLVSLELQQEEDREVGLGLEHLVVQEYGQSS